MFLGGWFLVRHVSIKVLWWLAFAIEISMPFSFVPSSCRGSCCCCSVSEDVPCLVVGARFWIASFVPSTVTLQANRYVYQTNKHQHKHQNHTLELLI